MNTYEYKLLRIEPYATDADAIEKLLNQNGEEGFRLISTCYPPYSDIAIRRYARVDRGLGYGV